MLEDSICATKCNWMHSNAMLGYRSKLKCLCWLFINITCLWMVNWHLWNWRKQRFRGVCVLFMTKIQNSVFLFSVSVYPTAKSVKGKYTRHVAEISRMLVFSAEIRVKFLPLIMEFRHVRDRNEKCLLISSCPPVQPSAPMYQHGSYVRIFVKFHIGDFYENCRENKNLFKRAQNIRHFTWRPSYVSFGERNSP
jgi:hypothetical protein